jgi:hypothetical protein
MLLRTRELDDSDAVLQARLNNLADRTTPARTPQIARVLIEEAVGEEYDPPATVVTYLLRPRSHVRHVVARRLPAKDLKGKPMLTRSDMAYRCAVTGAACPPPVRRGF